MKIIRPLKALHVPVVYLRPARPCGLSTVNNQKTPEYEDDFQTQVMTLYNPISMRHRNYAVLTDSIKLISDVHISDVHISDVHISVR